MVQREETLRFERRASDRWPVTGAATVFELGGERFGAMHPVAMLDYSEVGLAARSSTALPPGSLVSIGFQSPGYLARRGTVLRCQPCGEGYRIAIGFEKRLAA